MNTIKKNILKIDKIAAQILCSFLVDKNLRKLTLDCKSVPCFNSKLHKQ